MTSRVLVIGEALVDVVRSGAGQDREYPGGSGANTAVALSRLGLAVGIATAFTDDRYGDLVAQHLSASDVELAGDPVAIGRTSSAVARIGADGAARYTFDVQWALNPLTPEAVAPHAVHITSLGAVLEPGCVAARDLIASLRASATIAYDINVRAEVSGTGPEVVERVEALARLADIVKASDEDLETLWPGLGVDGAVGRLLELGAPVVIVTRGAEGATYRTVDRTGQIGAVEAEVVDTIGAGDTFAAAVLAGLDDRNLLGADRRTALRGLDTTGWDEVLGWAVRAAAVTVARPGADPPRREDVDQQAT